MTSPLSDITTDNSDVDVTAEQLASVLTGRWRRIHAANDTRSGATFVFQNCHDAGDVQVLTQQGLINGGVRISIPGAGEFQLAGYRDDSALVDLDEVLDVHDRIRVLRYRPGKRITLLVDRGAGSTVIIKCVARGVTNIFNRLQQIADIGESLPFDVSRPLWKNDAETVFSQQYLHGEPLLVDHLQESPALATTMASAINAFHQAPLNFSETFTLEDQRCRSERYVRSMSQRFPALSAELIHVMGQLDTLQARLESSTRIPPVPVHGALHTRQWLRKPDRLALVDFDRCAMGDAELDIATFLAEWDYESVPIGERVKSAFMAHINGKNVARIAFYRAHKHLSKAFKASRALKTGAQAKVQRNLQRLRWVLAQAPELGR